MEQQSFLIYCTLLGFFRAWKYMHFLKLKALFRRIHGICLLHPKFIIQRVLQLYRRCSKSSSDGALYVTEQKAFSNVSLVFFFCLISVPPIKCKLVLEISGKLLIANHMDQSFLMAKQKIVYLWRKVVCFVCTYEIHGTGMLQIVFLVSLESYRWEGGRGRCMGLVLWQLDLWCKSSWILNDFFFEN
jgi:hypothetical protein